MIALLVFLLAGGGIARAQFIPQGNEELLAAMLGRGEKLPGDCVFTGGQVDRTVVHATYRCAAGDVQIELSHSVGAGHFVVAVVGGTAPAGFVAALEASVRARESGFHWTASGVNGSRRGVFALLFFGLAAVACISGWRARATRIPTSPRLLLECAIVAMFVALSLQVDADPPAHVDTSGDVALARDCIASGGAVCAGHAASALGLFQGQSFTYAMAAWQSRGWSMRSLSVLAACMHGAAAGVLHYANSRRFGRAAWIVSGFIGGLGARMAGHPIMWNPTWFPLPAGVAFVCVLGVVGGGGLWSAFGAGVALALTAEAHVLFVVLAVVVAGLVFVTAERGATAAAMLLAAFVLVELVVSPESSTTNAVVLRAWLDAHRGPATTAGVAMLAAVPVLLWLRPRLVRRDRATREAVVAIVWLLAGLVAIGLVLPWAASRPLQIRYVGAALPAIAWTAAWLCNAMTRRAPSTVIWVATLAAFAVSIGPRVSNQHARPVWWFMDDAKGVANVAGLVDASALDLQMMVRTLPQSALPEAIAAFVGTPGLPAFPPRIVRAMLVPSETTSPAGWRQVSRSNGGVLVSTTAPWTHPEESEMCPEPLGDDTCIRLGRADFEDIARGADGVLYHVFGLRVERSELAIRRWVQRGARSLLWRIPLRPASDADDDVRREIVLRGFPAETVAGVDGTVWTSHGASRALVERPTAAASITVRTFIEERFEVGLPPLPMELTPTEAEVLGAVLPPP